MLLAITCMLLQKALWEMEGRASLASNYYMLLTHNKCRNQKKQGNFCLWVILSDII